MSRLIFYCLVHQFSIQTNELGNYFLAGIHSCIRQFILHANAMDLV